MSADSGLGPPNRETLGQMILPDPPQGNWDNYTSVYDGNSIYQRIRSANDAHDIEDLIFLMKLRRSCLETRVVAYTIEKILQGLLDPQIVRKYARNLTHLAHRSDPLHLSTQYIRHYREEIGKVAIEVFFDAVFERDKGALWGHFSRVPHGFEWVPNGTVFDPEPHSLLVFLHYFAACSPETKKGFSSKIKKFLECVLNEPLAPFLPDPKRHTTTVGFKPTNVSIPHTKKVYTELAQALVMNGMYEECLEIEEAYYPLVLKFVDGLKESKDGLVKFPSESFFPMGLTTLKEAAEKACEDKERGHMLGVIVRHAIKYKRAKVVNTFDPTNPSGFVNDKTVQGIQTHMAILWNNPALQVGI